MAVEYIDSAMEKLTQAIDKTGLPVNFIFLSDHGMEEVDRERPIRLPKIDTEKMQIVNNGTYTSIFVEDENNIEEIYNYFKKEATDQYAVYLKTEVPEKYCFSDKEDIFQRIGDIVLIAEAPYLITNTKPIAGAHGYLAEDTPNMNTVFMAWGLIFKKGNKSKLSITSIYIRC